MGPQAPTIGRTVHFTFDGTQPHAALVVYVWSDTCVNLAWFDTDGEPHSATSVCYSEDPAVNYTWRWPPRV